MEETVFFIRAWQTMSRGIAVSPEAIVLPGIVVGIAIFALLV